MHHARCWQAGGATGAGNLFLPCPADHAAVTAGQHMTPVTDKGRIARVDGSAGPRGVHVQNPAELLDAGNPDDPDTRLGSYGRIDPCPG